MPFTLLTGGARSGKSDTAERMAMAAADTAVMLATATGDDDEMSERISRHRDRRPGHWLTVEEPLDLVSALETVDADAFVILDCLTLWVSNALGDGWSDDEVVDHAASTARVLLARSGRAVVVTNEVGMGIVPDNPLARRYRDLLGTVNRVMADNAADVLLMVAGRAARTEPVEHA